VTHPPNPTAITEWTARAKQATPAVVRVIRDYHRAVRKIDRRDNLDAGTKIKLKEMARRDATGALESHRADFVRAREAIADLTDRAMKPQAGDTASELRIGAAWQRAVRIMDRSSDRFGKLTEIAERAVKQGDSDTLAALWREGPGYAESEDWPDADKLRSLLVHVGAPTEAAKAYASRTSFEKGAGRVELAFGTAATALTDDDGLDRATAPDQFPGFDEGEIYTVEAESPAEVHESEEARLRALIG